MSFDYESINPGYYHEAMLRGSRTQRFWHRIKFELAAQRIPKKPVKVLDVGSGPGSFFYVLRKNNKDAVLLGTDLVPKQVGYAKNVVPDAFWLASDATSLPVRHKSLDFVTMLEVIEHLPEEVEQKILEQIRKSLKKSGKLVISTPNYRSLWPIIEWLWNKISPVSYEHQHINKKNIRSLIKGLQGSGFKVSHVQTFFVVSPFIAVVSERLARFVLRLEQKLFPFFGSVILVEAVV
jgi:2-polyprenyl-3-methyl-5-hydroxy-6-metoxy-1,4-benzoquinol methylase